MNSQNLNNGSIGQLSFLNKFFFGIGEIPITTIPQRYKEIWADLAEMRDAS